MRNEIIKAKVVDVMGNLKGMSMLDAMDTLLAGYVTMLAKTLRSADGDKRGATAITQKQVEYITSQVNRLWMENYNAKLVKVEFNEKDKG